MQKIHPTAFIGKNVEIADDVEIGHCACIEDNVKIGAGTKIGQFASVKQFTTLGENNIIHSYACVGGEPQDLKFAQEETSLVIGNNNTFREFCTIHRGTIQDNSLTSIGNNNLFMAYTHIAHDCKIGSDIVMSNGATLAGHVEVQDFAIIGGLSAVHQFSRIGTYAFVGGMTGIPQDLPPFMLASDGCRGSVQSPNLVGLRRMQAKSEVISAIKHAYKLIWTSNTPRQEALKELEESYDFAEIKIFVDFVRTAQRGILPGRNDK